MPSGSRTASSISVQAPFWPLNESSRSRAWIGVAVAGIPHNSSGFVHTDTFGRIPALDDVYAAGDGTSFPIKQGGLAAQQADAAASLIARRKPALRSSPRRSTPFCVGSF